MSALTRAHAHLRVCFLLVSLLIVAGCAGPQTESTEQRPDRSTSTLALEPESTYSLAADPDYVQGAQRFDAQQALSSIEFLAADALQGRLVGTPGNQQAGDYIAECLAEYGLQPAGADGGYFQPFTSAVTLNIEEPVLTITAPGGAARIHDYVPHYEFSPRIARYLGSGEALGKAVWLGQGDASAFDASLEGTVVLCAPMAGPEQAQVVKQALKYGVGGLLFLREDEGPYARSAYGFGELIDIPAFGISYSIAEDLLAGSGYTLEDLDGLAVPTKLATVVHMENGFERTQTQARNVLGLLPGADPQLGDEVVIVGAHYDGAGVDPDGTIYNSANDNASGVGVMLEVARLWQEQGYRPARSVLFAAWDAEEQWALGSQHYLSAPIYPLDQTVAYLNLDMVGLGDRLRIYGTANAMADQLLTSAGALGFTPEVLDEYLAEDRFFHEAGLPTGWLTFGADSESSLYLHRPEDDPQVIQLDDLHTAGAISAHALYWMSAGR